MGEGFREFYLNPRYSDLKITCDGQTFPAHRVVVCSNSSYFAAACSDKFADGAAQEISITGFSPLQVKIMLQCLYMGYYTIKDEDVDVAALAVFGATKSLYRGITQRERIVIFHAQMYGVGACFQSRRLKFIAEQSFSDTFRQIKTVEAFTAAVEVIYSTTPESDRGLRKIVVQNMMDNNKGFDKVIGEVPKFATDLLISALCRIRRINESSRW
ncbi:BTB/POZ domain-containing protein [Aspergillus glaucus CBS 516.65]|uniref:BTB domain-containing protein n=1 Tax=Aspergillus glaucus CBS 516.65 TaxID=1160497 RepID=A0A1L9VVN6_ASPGL|nr:hypothetical protein ASPGLDRAFT_1011431 [Aspergillus glaucus CBS 516.65]OJJ87970.1 hypothetical protein ASPGLDRAFT_1011431 [Aspergillus glaucus CBS 516.65]